MRPYPDCETATVVDLFSGGGGMSCGFARTAGFSIVGAVDLERGKPSAGSTGCNGTYRANIGVEPYRADLALLEPSELREVVFGTCGIDLAPGRLDVLSACPPCTDFSRAKPANHLVDGRRNDLVGRVGDFVAYFRPRHLVMENAREFLLGAFRHHSDRLTERLRALGYGVATEVPTLTAYGLPQLRERALLVASRVAEPMTPADLWIGYEPAQAATTVRSALGRLAAARASMPADAMDRSPAMGAEVRARLGAVPRDGGSWTDLVRTKPELLTPGMAAKAAADLLNHHPDAYGRMAWSRPAPTIMRESSHLGNGRYAHPEMDRLLTVREMAALQGFPFDYRFLGALKNSYRQIGDAVPPIVSFQIAACIRWMESGIRPGPETFVLPDSTLRIGDVRHAVPAAA
ncbi:putative BsuMI modification methylase subunit YdiO [Methylobacterium hispanicum]|uniref:DNA (cytosine-5-)-methyltransferase n=1 Tax=Methylobacterium hispanicum TaxID=270350 RepID=A0AAV4ZS74_9HYPH|nr:DNA cytosine methyltransferase [Methylobacterium hispanicum]GJD90943.1 putative BsuMI modification methylase subunit YdiO [Methylobacterium hispanicum]